jgi:predicted GIY-YIG superfamily endonuclease
MFFVYILRSLSHPEQTYTGFTTDVTARFNKHNEGGSPHTARYRPWQLVWFCGFPDKGQALAFET